MMTLCIDVGNSQLYGGLFQGESLVLKFRHATQLGLSSDELGLFLKGVLHEHSVLVHQVTAIVYCSVVPQLEYSLRSACLKYFQIEPFAVHSGVETGLKIAYRHPAELGADRLVNAMAAVQLYPNVHLIIVDFGTATTLCVVDRDRCYLGGVIAPGFRLSVQALQHYTAKLPFVEIVKPSHLIGNTTIEGMQAGIFYAQLAMIQYLTQEIKHRYFSGEPSVVLATGGFSHLFQDQALFDGIHPDLILHGLRLAHVNHA